MKKRTRRLSEKLAASKDTIHRQIKKLQEHTNALDLYPMNLYINRLNVECISVVRISVIPYMIDLSG